MPRWFRNKQDTIYNISSRESGTLEYSRCLINVRFLIFLRRVSKDAHIQAMESWNGGKNQLSKLKWGSRDVITFLSPFTCDQNCPMTLAFLRVLI